MLVVSSNKLTMVTGVRTPPQTATPVVVASTSRRYEPTGTLAAAKLRSAASGNGSFVYPVVLASGMSRAEGDTGGSPSAELSDGVPLTVVFVPLSVQ